MTGHGILFVAVCVQRGIYRQVWSVSSVTSCLEPGCLLLVQGFTAQEIDSVGQFSGHLREVRDLRGAEGAGFSRIQA